MSDTPLSRCPWRPTQFEELREPPFDTSMGTAKVKTNATYGYLKAMGNRQGPHALASELVATSLADWFRLTVADFAVLPMEEVDCYPLPRGARVQPGPAFVSRALPGRTWGRSAEELATLVNPADITRLVVFDTWVRNCDRHPPDVEKRRPNYANVFLAETDKPDRNRLCAIDHSHCFDCGNDLTPHMADIGRVRDDGVYGLFPEFAPYIDPGELAWCRGMLQNLKGDDVAAIVAEIPPAWDVRPEARAALVELIVRRAVYLAGKIERGWGVQWWQPPAE